MYIPTTRDKMKYVYKDGVLRKFGARPDKHLMRKFGNTPGIDRMVLDTYPDCKWVKCYTTDNRKYTIAVSILQEMGTILDFGHGEQYFAQGSLWEITTVEPR